MKRTKILFLLVALVGTCSAFPQQSEKGSCAFGQEYNDGCNHCVCHGSSGATCTRLPGCSKSGGRLRPVSPTRDQVYNKGHCNLGPEFMKDCNICTCQGDLGYICTSKECHPKFAADSSVGSDIPVSPSRPAKELDIRGKCTLGHKFFNGCDLCTCYGEYFGYRCNRLENCREQYAPVTSTTERPTSKPLYYEKNLGKCAHGPNYYDGYYYCTCRKDNMGYMCKSTLSS